MVRFLREIGAPPGRSFFADRVLVVVEPRCPAGPALLPTDPDRRAEARPAAPPLDPLCCARAAVPRPSSSAQG